VSSGSAELDLLARDRCVQADEANKPFFVEARRAAAACAASDKLREPLLREAIAEAPGDADLRLRFAMAAFGAGHDTLALIAAGQAGGNGILTGAKNAEEADKLAWYLIQAHEKRSENADALSVIGSALGNERDDARRSALEKERDRLQVEVAREAENTARAPTIHKDLEQDHVVQPRLLPGMAFEIKKPEEGEEGSE